MIVLVSRTLRAWVLSSQGKTVGLNTWIPPRQKCGWGVLPTQVEYEEEGAGGWGGSQATVGRGTRRRLCQASSSAFSSYVPTFLQRPCTSFILVFISHKHVNTCTRATSSHPCLS